MGILTDYSYFLIISNCRNIARLVGPVYFYTQLFQPPDDSQRRMTKLVISANRYYGKLWSNGF